MVGTGAWEQVFNSSYHPDRVSDLTLKRGRPPGCVYLQRFQLGMARKFSSVIGVTQLDGEDLNLIDERLIVSKIPANCQVEAVPSAPDKRDNQPSRNRLVGSTVVRDDEHEYSAVLV